MKTKHFFLAAAALISALVACQKKTEDLGPEKVEINTAEVSLPADGGEATVNLTATVDWKAQIPAEAQEWLVVAPEEGSASASAQTVKVKALKNDGYDRSPVEAIRQASASSRQERNAHRTTARSPSPSLPPR